MFIYIKRWIYNNSFLYLDYFNLSAVKILSYNAKSLVFHPDGHYIETKYDNNRCQKTVSA
jgi:hypothetical protein